jgi:elongator complex protein 1
VWDTYAARLPMPNDTAAVVVVDGGGSGIRLLYPRLETIRLADDSDRLLITPFRTQNTPPPMSSYTISLPSTPVHVSVSNDEDALAVLLRDGRVQLWDLHTRLPGPKGSKLRGGGKVAEPVLRWEKRLEMEGKVVKQVGLGEEGVAVLSWSQQGGKVDILSEAESRESSVAANAIKVLWSERGWLILEAEGRLRTRE